MKKPGIHRLIIKRGDHAVEYYLGSYAETMKRFKAWQEDLFAGWTLEVWDRKDHLVKRFTKEVEAHA